MREKEKILIFMEVIDRKR